jgi:heme/copper-type cytochrome/quinol oxidase subunit 2
MRILSRLKRELRLHWLLLNGKVAEVEKEAEGFSLTFIILTEIILIVTLIVFYFVLTSIQGVSSFPQLGSGV